MIICRLGITINSDKSLSIRNQGDTELQYTAFYTTGGNSGIIKPAYTARTNPNAFFCIISVNDRPACCVAVSSSTRGVILYGASNKSSLQYVIMSSSSEYQIETVNIIPNKDCNGIAYVTNNAVAIGELGALPDDVDIIYGFAPLIVSPNGVELTLNYTNLNGESEHISVNSYKRVDIRTGDIILHPPEMYFTESSNDQNILHVPMESTTGTVITGESQSVQIPSSALLEVAQPKAPADVTIKYSGTSVPVVSNTPASRSRKKVT